MPETAERTPARMPSSTSRHYIFWPRNIISDGILYGWNLENGTTCVAGVLAGCTVCGELCPFMHQDYLTVAAA